MLGELVDGRYQIVELIGEGGMGRVYRAEQVRLQRSVAVKVLHQSWSNVPEVGRRFEREAIALARLDHPNCVAVQDFGRLPDGSLFLVMSYLRGALLRAALDDTPFVTGRALHVARHVAAGLAHAHQAGIVHRDVKPENVMLVHHEGDPDFAKIFDFGLVKLLEPEPGADTKLTMMGQRFGTPAYMSPEQALGRAVDPRSDLYSLTVVLYEMLTGRPLFAGADEESLLVMHAARAAPTLAEGAEGRSFPAPLEELVRRGLAKKPEERPADAGEYLAALDACAEALSPSRTSLPLPSLWSRAARTMARPLRSRRVLAVLGAMLVAAAGGFALQRALRPHHAAHARALLDGGRPQEAAAYLQERLKEIADDAPAQLELGHADAALRRYDEALVAYERVRSLDRSLADDRTMRTNLMLMLDDERNETASGAARFLIQFLDDEGARARLVELASSSRSPQHRDSLRELAESLGLSARVDLLASYRLDLEQGASCADRQRAVAQLRALRDPAALAALHKAEARKSNACLRDDAADAIRYLDSLGAAN
ncbi:MAG TPA: protein kinase [Polyangia bacterium]|jgi:tetratricopeptide (TPR) repeat protein